VGLPVKGVSVEERLSRRLVRQPKTWCLEWTGATNGEYGEINVDGKPILAHRLAWTLWVGPIPEGQIVRHYVCDNPPCCEPTHLRLGTHADNMADKIAKGRDHNQKKTHCLMGHPYDADNTYIAPGHNGRQCRICHVAAMDRFIARRKAALLC